MVGKEKHVVAVLHFTGQQGHFTCRKMQLVASHLAYGTNYIYTAIIKGNTGRKGEKQNAGNY